MDGVGRGIALDRDGNYAKIQKAYECMTLGKGPPAYGCAYRQGGGYTPAPYR